MLSRNPPQAGVYRIVNVIDGKVYIGGSGNLYQRKYQHFGMLKSGRHHSGRLQEAYNQFGKKAFQFEVLRIVDDFERRLIEEQKYIDQYKSADPMFGYNIAPLSVSTQGIPCAESTKAAISLANTGLKRSEAWKARLSHITRLRNINASQETHRRWSMAQKRRQRSDAFLEKLRQIGLSNRSLTESQVDEMIDMKTSGASHSEISVKFNVHKFYFLNSPVIKKRMRERGLAHA